MLRQFTGKKLLDQLQTGSVKRHFENAYQPVSNSQLFSDITSTTVDSVLTDLELEAVEVANILACVKPAQIGFSENTPFALVSDYDECIVNWASGVIQHACAELLTKENAIKPAILAALPASVSTNLKAEDLVLSYFNALKNAAEGLIKQKLRHINSTNHYHVENVYVVFDNRTQEDNISELIKQEFKKRNPTENHEENMSASMILVKRSGYGYRKAQWALGWQNGSQNHNVTKTTTPTIKVRP